VIAATNRDLARAVRLSHFRADLFYRLNVFPVTIPPLRERREDVPLLAQHFVRQFAGHLHRTPPAITDAAVDRLLKDEWRGNVRELENTMQRAVILTDTAWIEPQHIVLGPPPLSQQEELPLEILPLEEYERRYLQRVLEHTNGVIHGRRGAAVLLGVKPTTLRSRLERLGLK
jgi:formate hydrogenlyase transcriptional activator